MDGETKVFLVNNLRAIELTVAESCRKAAINPQTYYRWRSATWE